MSDKLLPCKLCGSEARPVTLEDRWTWCTGGKCEMYDQEIRAETWNAVMDTEPPKGYMLVPAEPTRQMLDSSYYAGVSPRYGEIAYKAMIAAAKEASDE